MEKHRLWLQLKMILIVRRTAEGGLSEPKCGLDYDAEAAASVCVCVCACRAELQKVYKVTCDLCGSEISGQVEKFAEIRAQKEAKNPNSQV